MNSEQVMARSLERDALALEISGDGAWELSALGAKGALEAEAAASYAPRFAALLGYEEHELPPVAGTWLGAMDADDRERFRRALAEHAEGQTPRVDLEVRVRTKQGEARWWRVIGRVFPAGEPAGARAVGIVRDVTGERHERETHQRTFDLWRQTQAVARVGGWELDVVENKNSWTEETYRIHEVPPDFEPRVDKGIKFYAPEHVPVITAAVEGCLRGEPFDVELDLITYTGRRITVQATGRPHFEDGKVTRIYGAFRDITETRRREAELRAQVALIEQQQRAIQALSSPIIQVWDNVLTLPLIGVVDAQRAAQIMDRLLAEVVRVGARFAILDLTGVEAVDTTTADQLLRISRAVNLLGATALLCGLTPPLAQTLTALGVEISPYRTHRNLQQALRACIRELSR